MFWNIYTKVWFPLITSGIQDILRALFKNLSPPLEISCSNCDSIILGLPSFQINDLKSLLSLLTVSLLGDGRTYIA